MFNVEYIKENFPKGTRVELIEMPHESWPVEPGTKGTVKNVDDIGTIHVNWDNGRSLGLIPYVDKFRTIKEEE